MKQNYICLKIMKALAVFLCYSGFAYAFYFM